VRAQIRYPTFVSGNQLLELCNGSMAQCQAYVAGAVDAMSTAGAITGTFAEFRICMPHDVVLGQLVDVILNDLRAHPEILQLNAASEAAYALQQAFPCPK
jgi:hypothetical protein